MSLMHTWLLERVQLSPKEIALQMGNKRLTYQELNQAAIRVAKLLLAKGVKQGNLVGILAESGPELVISLLACIKIGAVFVPCDPDYPEARLATIAEMISAKRWLVMPKCLDKLKKIVRYLNLEKIRYDIVDQHRLSTSSDLAEIEPDLVVRAKDPCYIFFTSGSTGKPKGILGSYKGLEHFIQWEIAEFKVSRSDRISQLTTPAFDAVLRDIFVPLVAGATICIPEEKEIIYDAERLVSWIDREKITLIHCVPSLFRNLLTVIDGAKEFLTLRYILLAGEPVRISDVKSWFQKYGDRIKLVNLYGSSEMTMIKLYHQITREDLQRKTIPIGQPMPGTKVIILDEQKNPCPPGVIGEIYIRSPYLTLGYYQEPAKTQEVFLVNPFSQNPEDLIYKTGDLGRLLPDGNLEFIGRKDNQVKIRGQRVELGEIEALLSNQPTVQEVVVLTSSKRDGDNRLVAYLVGNTDLRISDLRDDLKKNLPFYMIPESFYQLDKLPLTPNGKIDRQSLLDFKPDDSILDDFGESVAPRDQLEKQLLDIFLMVLNQQQMGVNDSFFDYGGHSLNASRVISRIYRQLSIQIPLRIFFQNPTVAELARKVKKAQKIVYQKIEPTPEQSFYPTSHGQRRLWILSQLDEELNSAYNISTALQITGPIEIAVFQQAFDKLIQRHEILRTSFTVIDGEPMQIVYPNSQFQLTCEQLSEELSRDELVNNLTNRPFELTQPGLFRANLFQLTKESWIFVFTIHHIISDGWSQNLLVQELFNYYTQIITDQKPQISPLPIQYRDYALWQKKMLTKGIWQSQSIYWQEKYAGQISILELPTDYPRPPKLSYRGGNCQLTINLELTNRLKRFARKIGITFFSLLFSGYNLLLYRYSGQNDLVIGLPVHGRSDPNLEELIGFFINTLPIRIWISAEKSFTQFAQDVHSQVLSALENQDYPFDLLVEELQLERDYTHAPLLTTIFVLQNIPDFKDSVTEIANLSLQSIDVKKLTSRNDLALTLFETESGITISCEYSTELFHEKTILQMLKHYENLLRGGLLDPTTTVGQLEILTPDEKDKLLHLVLEKNSPQHELNASFSRCLHQLVEDWAEKTPDKTALILQEKELSYQELNQHANQLATYLCQEAVQLETPVALLFDRSFEMVIAMLGVLKAGGVFIPLDPDLPQERLTYIINNTTSRFLITQPALVENISQEFTGQIISLTEDFFENLIDSGEGQMLLPTVNPKNLAYIIYTSGSTGQPKGVMIEHHSIVNSVLYKIDNDEYSADDRSMQLLSYAFDGGQFEIWVPLAVGATLVMVTNESAKDVQKINQLLTACEINHIIAIPSLFQSILTHPKFTTPSSLKNVTVGGERLSKELVDLHRQLLKTVTLTNEYGPTEAAVLATSFKILPGEDISGYQRSIPIGKPITNTHLLILDKDLQLVPQGVLGEIHLGGSGLARGYLGEPGLDNKKFIPHPFKSNQRLYKTGDLGCYLPDGNIEFSERLDQQVKIRGYRIELGEIEANLSKLPDILKAVVTDHLLEDGSTILVAYLVSKAKSQLDTSSIRQKLQEILPIYMIPNVMMVLDELPETSSGKVDRQALPEPVIYQKDRQYEPPTTEIELVMAKIWQRILGVQNLGIRDNFFELGGDSIKAIQIVAQLNSLGYTLQVKDILTYQTIEQVIFQLVKPKKDTDYEQGHITGDLPLTAIQRWFINWQHLNPTHWNQSIMIELKPSVDFKILQIVLRKIVDYHDTLALNYQSDLQRLIYQINCPFGIEEIDLGDLSKDEQEAKLRELTKEAKASFNFDTGRLFKAILFNLGELRGQRLLLSAHHLIIDGISWRIILHDLVEGYLQYKETQQINLLPKTASFKKWAEQIQTYSQSAEIIRERPYWDNILAQEFLLPIDEPTGENLEKDRITLTTQLTKTETQLLISKVNSAYNTTIEDILITALALTIRDWTAEEIMIINLEKHGREELLGLDLTRTVGWFTAEFPAKIDLRDLKTIADQIKGLKEQLHRIPHNGFNYGILRYLTDVWDRKKPQSISILFNYLGEFEEDLSDGLFRLTDSLGGEKDLYNQHVSELDFSCISMARQMVISINYSQNRYYQNTMLKLLDYFMVNLRTIIEYCRNKDHCGYTPVDFDLVELSADFLDQIDKRVIADIYPLTPMQEGMLYQFIRYPESTAYFQQPAFRIKGNLQVANFQKAWNHVIKNNEILRTVFRWRDLERPQQLVYRDSTIELNFVDLTQYLIEEKEQKLAEIKSVDLLRGFDLETGPLMRVTVCQLEENVHKENTFEIIWSFHHILIDGWCTGIVFKELFAAYLCLEKKRPLPVNKKNKYREYIRYLKEQDQSAARLYWQEYLADFITPTELPFNPQIKEKTGQMMTYQFDPHPELSGKVTELAKRYQVTVNLILQLAWGILLQKYTQKRDVVFGVTVAGRPVSLSGVEEMVGLFINTVPLRIKNTKETPVFQLLLALHKESIERNNYEHLPLVDIKEQSEISGITQLFNHILVFENYPLESKALGLKPDWKILNYSTHINSDYQLNLIATNRQEELQIKFLYDSLLTEEAMIRSMGNHLLNLLQEIVADPEVSIGSLQMLSVAEKDLLITGFNQTRIEPLPKTTLHELVERWANCKPKQTALIFGSAKMSYSELDARAHFLAKYLLDKGVVVEEPVAILVESAFERIISMLAVLKVGAAYLPITADYPRERINFILQDATVRFVLTETQLQADLFGALYPEEYPQFLYVDMLIEDLLRNQSDDVRQALVSVKPDHLAYLIYTSGSTGVPKGVMIEHRSIVNSVNWKLEKYQYTADDKLLQMLSYSFDGAQLEIWTALAAGIPLVLAEPKVKKDLLKLVNLIREEKISHFTITPSLYSGLLTYLEEQVLTEVKVITLAGEQLSTQIWQKHQSMQSQIFLINEYGPTETAVVATSFDLSNFRRSFKRIPIGKPINNMKLYILDEELEPLPLGVPGEIYLSGRGLARGYLNHPELTELHFIPNPYQSDELMYKTGDRGKFLFDANVEFLGRSDHQVKINGYRVELSEIEHRLLAHQKIKEAVVLAKFDQTGNGELHAFLVFVTDQHLTTEEIKNYLRRLLPSYMIPEKILVLETLLLTMTGKVDQQALLALQMDRGGLEDYAGPRTMLEKTMSKIWSDLLEREDVGINDNFFELGGHSLKATQLMVRIYKEFSVECPLDILFEYPTIAQLGEYLKKASKIDYQEIKPQPPKKWYPVSHGQKRLWVFEQFPESRGAYIIPAAWVISGQLNIEALEKAFQAIVKRHEVLRTSFQMVEEEVVQIIDEESVWQLDYEDQLIDQEEVNMAELHAGLKSFDLTKPSQMRVKLIKLEPQKYLCLFVIHHIIADGWSLQILINELVTFYDFYAQELSPTARTPLKPLRIQYKDYAVWQNQLLKSEKIQKQENYWVQQFSGELPVLQLPTDFSRPKTQTFRGADLTFVIDPQLSAQLNRLAVDQGVTLFMLLFSVYILLLYRYTNQTSFIVGTPIAGRSDQDLENLIGFFVNTIAIQAELSADQRFIDLLSEVRTKVIKDFQHQDYPFDALVDKLNLQRDLSRSPLFDTMFILQNFTHNSSENYRQLGMGVDFKPLDFELGISKYDLALTIGEQGSKLFGSFNYNTSLFQQETIKRMIGHFQELIKNIVASPKAKITDLDMLTLKERKMILGSWSGQQKSYPTNRSIPQIFTKYACQLAKKIAVICAEKKLDYQELDQKSNQLARFLISKGIGKDDLVGIMLNRSVEVMISILGILKAGGAYLLIDADYPIERIKYLIADSQIKVLLSECIVVSKITQASQQSIEELLTKESQLIFIDQPAVFSSFPKTDPEVHIAADSLAYVIYTSGSTGDPKGVMIEHRNLLNQYYASLDYFGLSSYQPVLLQLVSHSFDVFVADLCRSVYCGGTMILTTSEERLSPENIYQLIERYQVNIIASTPTFILVFFDYLVESQLQLSSLKWLLLGGESLTCQDYDRINQFSQGCFQVVNCYGLTEATVESTYFHRDQVPAALKSIPIGRPISNSRIYILNSAQQPVPIGVVGEIYIGGLGVARGYLHRSEVTNQRFLTNPFIEAIVDIEDQYNWGKKIYQTGDLGKWLTDGNIQFLGRQDQQVKIRGFRVELGEIEYALLKHPDILQAVVVQCSDATKANYLVGYVVSRVSIQPTELELKAFLMESLPDYMIPLGLIYLDHLPLTPNGKINYADLPEYQPSISYQKPRNLLEVEVQALWSEVLQIEEIGMADDFFHLGGNSIKLIQLLMKLNNKYEIGFTLKDLMENTTIASCAAKIQINQGQSHSEEKNCLVCLRRGTSADHNIFCLHPGGGGVVVYQQLAELIEQRYNVYGIQAKGLFSDEPLPQTMDELIREYLIEMKKVQSSGPYYLLGHSLGGNIAYEIGIRLEEQGEKIARLIFLDTLSYSLFKYLPSREVQKRSLLLFDLQKLGIKLSSDVEKMSIPEIIAEYIQSDTFTMNQLLRLSEVRGNIIDLIRLPSKIVKADLQIIRAEESVKKFRSSGWSKWTRGSAQIINVKGDHNSMLEMPFAQETVQVINQIIK